MQARLRFWIQDRTAAVLDHPVTAVDPKQALGAGLSGGTAGDGVSELAGECAGFLLQDLPLDEEGLVDLGEVEIAVEGLADPDRAGLDAPVAAGGCGEVRAGAGPEVALEIGRECRAIALESASEPGVDPPMRISA